MQARIFEIALLQRRTLMAKKSKAFAELLRQQHKGEFEERSINQLIQKVQKSDFAQNLAGIVTIPKGLPKMSEVLESFVEPYLVLVTTHSQRDNLFHIAVIAWNLALMPEKKRQPKLEEILGELAERGYQTVGQGSGKIMDALIARKLKLFSDNRRYIIEFHFVDTPDSYHLSVAATLTDPFASE